MTKYLLFLFTSSILFSQNILEHYPPNQNDYVGGNIQFYKDFQQVLQDKKLQPCADKNENLSFQIVVYPDRTIKYVKSIEPEVEKYKCTFELSKEVAKYLKGWNPAELEGKKIAAITSFLIIPNELFSDLKEGYDPVQDMKLATYEGGIQSFRKKVFNSVDLSRFNFTGTFRLELTFMIENNGEMSNIELDQSSGLKEFDDMVVRSISRIKNKWTPASIHGIPLRSKFRLPLAFSM